MMAGCDTADVGRYLLIGGLWYDLADQAKAVRVAREHVRRTALAQRTAVQASEPRILERTWQGERGVLTTRVTAYVPGGYVESTTWVHPMRGEPPAPGYADG